MSEMAKEARAKMREKARRMTEAGDPNMKVDASSWMPTEQLNANAKTGLRPVSRRQFRKGGKVLGKESTKHAGKKPRVKMTGDDPITANSYLNRNVKEANAELGKPHVGGFRKGGAVKRKHKADGGSPDGFAIAAQADRDAAARRADAIAAAQAAKSQPKKPMTRDWGPQGEYAGGQDIVTQGRKHGGSAHRKHKMDGGMNMSDPRAVAASRMAAANQQASVPSGRMGFQARGGQPMPMSGMKRGGKTHPDAAADKKLIKKAFRQHEDAEHGGKHVPLHLRKGGEAEKCWGGRTKKAGGGDISPDEMEAARRVMRVSKKRPDAVDEDIFDKSARAKYMQQKYDEYRAAKDQDRSAFGRASGGKAKKAGGGRIPLSGHPYHSKSDAELRYISKDAAEAARNMKDVNSSAEGKYLDQMNDAQTILGHRQRTAGMTTRKPRAQTKDELMDRVEDKSGLKRGGKAGNYTGGTRPTGGRVARATGGGLMDAMTGSKSKGKGKGKGKTQINIVIGAGGHRPDMQQGQMMPPPGGPAPARPVAVPPPPMGGMPMGGMPMGGMPMPPGGGAPMPMPPPQQPPMGRKRGGKVGHRSYKSTHDMDAGAGGGYGRIEKAEIYGLRPAKNR